MKKNLVGAGTTTMAYCNMTHINEVDPISKYHNILVYFHNKDINDNMSIVPTNNIV